MMVISAMLAEPKNTGRSTVPADPQIGAPESVDRAEASPKLEKPKKKRPSPPTYDDGATTRHFKFPSRTHPKSSYYVTNTDIIIRIKKARKKWKLVLPKKRVVSYKTNRWFAKPRWIEIELTYTQAFRHGLVGERTGIVAPELSSPETLDAATGMLADEAISRAACYDEASATGLAVQADDDNDAYTSVDDLEEPEIVVQPAASAANLRFSAAPSQSDRDDESARSRPMIAPPAVMRPPLQPKTITPPPRMLEQYPTPTANREQRRTNYRPTIIGAFTLALVLLTGAATWQQFATFITDSTPPEPQNVALEHHAPEKVTLSPTIELPAVPRPIQEPPPPPPTENTPAHAQILEAPLPKVETHDTASRPASPAEIQPPESVIAASDRIRTSSIESGNKVVAMAVDPQPQRNPAPNHPTRTADLAACRQRTATTISTVSIQFEYGSASLPHPGYGMLDRLAEQLLACPTIVMTIAGHTDSDGRTDRNQKLSVRRAETIRQLLVDAGIEQRQLSVIGRGQTQPLAPNNTDANKRRNRRIELALE